MGMFDDLRCEYPLPDCPIDAKGLTFQTKSLDCVMDFYTITKTGELRHDVWVYESVPKSERPYPNDDGLLGVAGSLRKSVISPNVLVDYDGLVEFYHYIKNGESLDYIALFEKGHLKSILRQIESVSEEEMMIMLKQDIEKKQLESSLPEAETKLPKKWI